MIDINIRELSVAGYEVSEHSLVIEIRHRKESNVEGSDLRCSWVTCY